jgi:phospholipid transport system substrate-binding protein
MAEKFMKISTKLFAVAAFAVSTLVSGSVLAQEAPDVLIKRLSQEVIATAKADKDIQSGNRQRIMQLVEAKILPHADFQRTTELVAGRYWRAATPLQQQQLINEFRTLLIYTYSGAMAQVSDQQFEFKPLRADPADTEVEVHSLFRRSRGADPIQVSYRLTKAADGWKIYDVNVMGVWLVETYKSNFSAEIAKGGIDGLIQTLSEKNKKLATGAGAKPSRASNVS